MTSGVTTVTATSALSRETPTKETPETAETHVEKRLKRLWVRIGETMKRLWSICCSTLVPLGMGRGAISVISVISAGVLLDAVSTSGAEGRRDWSVVGRGMFEMRAVGRCSLRAHTRHWLKLLQAIAYFLKLAPI
jgi:hypothetical protein